MGSLLNVKPILAIQDGEVVPVTRVRGRAKAFEEFRKRFEEATDGRARAFGRDRRMQRRRTRSSSCRRSCSRAGRRRT